MKDIKKPSIEKIEEFLPAEKFQERGMIGNTGFSGICSGPRPIAMLDDGQIFEYSREHGTRKLD